MNTALVTQIVLIFVSVIFGGLFTFFITTLTQRKVFKSIAEELTIYHEKIYHKHSMEQLIKEHTKDCTAVRDVSKLKTGMIWLVSQAGGNPRDLGLD